ncbi:two-component system response regulator [Streptomyces sp. NPDC087525]|uniref:response regulator n=1 Tax=Streptomyces sp. NPDC087525 TaxID=3365793 RepID=UPI0037F61453
MSRTTATTDRASILLVDDLEDNLVALEAVLASLDEPLVRARSGEEAVRALLREPFALILLDVRMPGMDGFETAYRIKRLDRAKDIPIIFLNGPESDSGYAFRGYATGAADFLTKPFDPWMLRAKVSVFLDLHRKNRQLERLLAREQEHLGEIADRLASIEDELRGGAPAVLDSVGKQLARIGETLDELRRGRGQ